MAIKIIAVGKVKEAYLREGIAEYTKRLHSYTTFEIIELADEATQKTASEKENIQIKNKEGERILAKISPDDYVIEMAIKGKQITSEAFAEQIRTEQIYCSGDIVFVIGGSLGTSQAVTQRANAHISFGKVTYPHQLMRLILIEQIYRAYRIINGHAYHK